MSGLTLRHLSGFIAVADAGHFGRAAKQLQIAQPLLSQMILRLEETMSARLFIRRPLVRLTPAGEIFLPHARRALEEFGAGVASVSAAASGKVGQLNLGFPTLLSLSWLPEAIAAYQRSHPRVRISYFDLTTAEQFQAIHSRRIDIAFVRQEESDRDDIKVIAINREPLVLAMSSGHPLTLREEVGAKELASERFILFPRHTAPQLFDSIIHRAREAGLDLNPALEGRDWLTVTGLVRAGAGISFVPFSLMKIGLPGLTYRRVQDLRLNTTLSLAHLSILDNPVLIQFISAVMEFERPA